MKNNIFDDTFQKHYKMRDILPLNGQPKILSTHPQSNMWKLSIIG
jgi:hypothetical protein